MLRVQPGTQTGEAHVRSQAARGGQALSGSHVTENGPGGPPGTGLVLRPGGAHHSVIVETANLHVSSWRVDGALASPPQG